MMLAFKTIRARAAKRKGGDEALVALLPKVPSQKALARLPDDRVLAEMARRIFSAGFVWSVIAKKWSGFEMAFLDFEPKRLLFQGDEFWERLLDDQRIVRHPAKVNAVRENARFVLDVSKEHGSFGKFLAQWAPDDQVGLLEVMDKRGVRLGGMTGQYVLRFLGKDCYITSADVVACLVDGGLPISGASTKKDKLAIQQQMNAWQQETGLPYTHLSRICALSIDASGSGEEEEA